MSVSSSSSSDFSAPPGRLSNGGGATSSGVGATAAATAAAAGGADRPQLAIDSSDDDASREMNVANVQLDQSPSSLRSNDAAGAAAKRNISSVDTSTKEPPPKKVAADPSKTIAGSDEKSATSTGGSAVPAPTATGGSLNDMPNCDPTFAARVNLDPVPPAKPLPKLSHRDIAELELVSMVAALLCRLRYRIFAFFGSHSHTPILRCLHASPIFWLPTGSANWRSMGPFRREHVERRLEWESSAH